ncbi:hypothetical protein [Marinobacter sp. PE14]
MNKLLAPKEDDSAGLKDLAHGRGKYASPLQSVENNIVQQYLNYEKHLGNPWSINPINLNEDQKRSLAYYYKNPTKKLAYINDIRANDETDVCPMCGSLHRGTLDHFFPQADYPEFSLFSLNLVPACKCNILRQTKLKGKAPSERVLHPYFDACLSERLLKARFKDLGDTPSISVEICVSVAHPNYTEIQYHAKNIVESSRLYEYLNKRWRKLLIKPKAILSGLKWKTPRNKEDLIELIEGQLETEDEDHESKNNWRSIFVCGLLERDLIDWMWKERGRLF